MILFKIPFFAKAALKYAFQHQRKPQDFTTLEQCFIDSHGTRYYRFKDMLDMPIKRLTKLQVTLMEMNACLGADELATFTDAMQAALDETVRPAPGKKATGGLSKIGFLLTELQYRRENLLHEEVMFSLAACIYIREDESLAEVDETVHAEKIRQFKLDSQGGLYDFFYVPGLRPYMRLQDITPERLEALLEMSKTRMMATQEMMVGFTTEAE
jgi:hypothetical protein